MMVELIPPKRDTKQFTSPQAGEHRTPNNVRLSPEKAKYIKAGLKKLDPESAVYLFGSRAYNHTKGGDIDILWLTREKKPQREIRSFRVAFYKIFGWQKLDIVNFTFEQQDTFKEMVQNSAVEL